MLHQLQSTRMKVWGTRPDGAGRLDSSCALLAEAAPTLENEFRVCEGFPGGEEIKNPPAKQETRVQSPGQEDPLEEDMATHSSLLARRIPWTEEPSRSRGPQRAGHNRSDWASGRARLSWGACDLRDKARSRPWHPRILKEGSGHTGTRSGPRGHAGCWPTASGPFAPISLTGPV